MRLGISNIAWEPQLDDDVGRVLSSHGIDTLDIAPSKYFELGKVPDRSEVIGVRRAWEARGLQIWGMQSLMFGSPLNLFGPATEQNAMLDWLDNVCAIAELLGASYLVFGSPKNRNTEGLGDTDARTSASEFFLRLGDIASSHNTVICVEPNPPEYGANFLTTSGETLDFVTHLDHHAIRMQFDTGALAMQSDNRPDLIQAMEPFIGHIHLSAPHLSPIHQRPESIEPYVASITTLSEKSSIIPTIEMLTNSPENVLNDIAESVAFTVKTFRGLDRRESLT